MAEIQQNDSGKGKKKGHQKKMTIRVDFTPMVDMNMLLITFFMLCTTMIKSQTLSISLPVPNDNPEDVSENIVVDENEAVTIILDAKRKPGSNEVDSINGNVVNEVYYYFGMPFKGQEISIANNNLEKTEFLTDEVNGNEHTARGIRKILQERNEQVYNEIQALKKKYSEGGFGSLETDKDRKIAKEKYEEAASAVRQNADYVRPIIIIKSTPEASYGGLVEILDEMQINSISRYRINNMTQQDSLLLQTYMEK